MPVSVSRTVRAFDLAVAQQQLFRRDMIGDGRAMGIGIDQAFQRDAFGRIHLGVVIFEGALEAVAFQHRLARQRVLRGRASDGRADAGAGSSSRLRS